MSKQLELPPQAARAFVQDMRAFHKAPDQLAGDEIAARQCWLLTQHLPKGAKVEVTTVKQLFHAMKDHA